MNAVKKKRVLLGFLSLILIISAYILYLNFSTKEITVLSSQTTSVSLNLPKNCSIQNENEDLKVNGKSEKNYNVDNDKIDVKTVHSA